MSHEVEVREWRSLVSDGNLTTVRMHLLHMLLVSFGRNTTFVVMTSEIWRRHGDRCVPRHVGGLGLCFMSID